jgi:hypothetical protein
MRQWRILIPIFAILSLLGSSLPAGAQAEPDQHRKMTPLFQSPNARVNSDLAFWGNYAFQGYYDGTVARTRSRCGRSSRTTRPIRGCSHTCPRTRCGQDRPVVSRRQRLRHS